MYENAMLIYTISVKYNGIFKDYVTKYVLTNIILYKYNSSHDLYSKSAQR